VVTTTELEKLKIDVVEEVHRVREKLAGYSSERIQELATKAKMEMEKLKKVRTE